MDAAGTFTRYSRVLSPAMERVADSEGAFPDSARVATPAGGAGIGARGVGPRERAARTRAARAVAARNIAGARQVCFDRVACPAGNEAHLKDSSSSESVTSETVTVPSNLFGSGRDVVVSPVTFRTPHVS